MLSRVCFQKDLLKHIFEGYKKAGSCANWLHIAGNNGEILQYYQDIGVEIANIDYSIPLELAMAKLPSICIDGDIKSLSFLSESHDYIFEQSQLLLKAFAHRGGFILSSGCEIPPESLPFNYNKDDINRLSDNPAFLFFCSS